jgi:hypothetical protein
MNDTKPDTVRGNEIEELKGVLQRLAEDLAEKFAGRSQQVSEAALGLIAALEYGDETLFESSSASLAAGLAEVANGCVARELRASEGTQTGLREAWARYIDKKAYELSVFEDIRNAIESLIDERVGSMLKLRKLVQSVEKFGQPVERSRALEEGIRELRQFREDLLRGWPSRKPPAPLDREGVSRAREALRRGEKGMSKDQLVWRDKRSEKPAKD